MRADAAQSLPGDRIERMLTSAECLQLYLCRFLLFHFTHTRVPTHSISSLAQFHCNCPAARHTLNHLAGSSATPLPLGPHPAAQRAGQAPTADAADTDGTLSMGTSGSPTASRGQAALPLSLASKILCHVPSPGPDPASAPDFWRNTLLQLSPPPFLYHLSIELIPSFSFNLTLHLVLHFLKKVMVNLQICWFHSS